MSGSQYPSDVQFAGLIQAATAAADAQERNTSVLGKRSRAQDDNMIDIQLRAPPSEQPQNVGQLPRKTPILQSSASVLFREPSEKSKKYSRPPLGQVYTDLEMAPENFLRLQNAAKTFMLDEDHTHRRDVVGRKKQNSNVDEAKLRLYRVVEEFLETDDNGELWFGRNAGVGVPDAPPRTIFWPEDKKEVIRLCMPLFRKMVTNERQRVYAIDTRKKVPSKTNKNKISENTALDVQSELASEAQVAVDEPSAIDQSLDSTTAQQEVYSANASSGQNVDTLGQLTLHVNILADSSTSNHRLVPRFSMTSNVVPSLSILIAEARKRYGLSQISVGTSADDWFMPAVKVWLPDGVVRIKDDGQWMVALLSASMVDWMDSEVRVIIDVGDTPSLITVD